MSDLAITIKEKTELAISQLAKRTSTPLDLTEASMIGVEEILQFSSEFLDDISESDIDAIIELLGSYILQAAYNEFGGAFQWYDERDQPVLVVGEPDFHLAIMTFDKVRGRLAGDTADNIPFFYSGFAERARKKFPGDRALYV